MSRAMGLTNRQSARSVPAARRRALSLVASVGGSLVLLAACATTQVPYTSYCLESRAVKASPVLVYYGYERPRDWQIARGGNWGGARCGFTEAHELRVKWKTASGVDREEQVDLRGRLLKTIDTSQHSGQVFMDRPLVAPPTLRVDVEDSELRVTFDATVWYVGERRSDGGRPHTPVTLTRELYRSSDKTVR